MLLQLLQATLGGATLAIACTPLDAGQTDVMTDRRDTPMEDFRDTERPPLMSNN